MTFHTFLEERATGQGTVAMGARLLLDFHTRTPAAMHREIDANPDIVEKEHYHEILNEFASIHASQPEPFVDTRDRRDWEPLLNPGCHVRTAHGIVDSHAGEG